MEQWETNIKMRIKTLKILHRSEPVQPLMIPIYTRSQVRIHCTDSALEINLSSVLRIFRCTEGFAVH
jgi:hypothetical protein